MLLGQSQRELAGEDQPLLVGLHLERARIWTAAADPARAISEGRAALAVFERLGAARDADGWPRCFAAWATGAGPASRTLPHQR